MRRNTRRVNTESGPRAIQRRLQRRKHRRANHEVTRCRYKPRRGANGAGSATSSRLRNTIEEAATRMRSPSEPSPQKATTAQQQTHVSFSLSLSPSRLRSPLASLPRASPASARRDGPGPTASSDLQRTNTLSYWRWASIRKTASCALSPADDTSACSTCYTQR